jgi:hypothetical protein
MTTGPTGSARYRQGDGQPFISKSKFLSGLQCRKLLWFAYNAKDEFPDVDAQTQAIFDQGHEVGNLAKQLFPGGIEVGQGIVDVEAVIRLTQEAVRQRRPLYEAAFASNGACARVDILNPVGKDKWDIVEVKSGTSVKDVHLPDIAFQAFVCAGAGLNIRRCSVLHINSDYVRKGEIDPRKLFKQVDVTAQVAEMSRQIEPQLEEMFKTIRRKQAPPVAIGPHCTSPYDCPVQHLCWSHLPAGNPTTLYRGRAKGFKLLADGVTSLEAIPPDYPLTDNQKIQRTAAITGQPQVSKGPIRQFLALLEYPRYFLDFETFGTAIPLLDGTSPFEQIPFQFSLHIQRTPGGDLDHVMYLAESRGDPRREFLERLRASLGDTGSIIVYNAAFEKGVLDRCAEVHPVFKVWVKQVKGRIVDLLIPFRSFRYYHPNQHGSASIKAVLPALTGRGYGGLEIQEGGTASLEFVRVTFGDVPDAERWKVRRQLEEYCGRDTMAMVWVVDALNTQLSSKNGS